MDPCAWSAGLVCGTPKLNSPAGLAAAIPPKVNPPIVLVSTVLGNSTGFKEPKLKGFTAAGSTGCAPKVKFAGVLIGSAEGNIKGAALDASGFKIPVDNPNPNMEAAGVVTTEGLLNAKTSGGSDVAVGATPMFKVLDGFIGTVEANVNGAVGNASTGFVAIGMVPKEKGDDVDALRPSGFVISSVAEGAPN